MLPPAGNNKADVLPANGEDCEVAIMSSVVTNIQDTDVTSSEAHREGVIIPPVVEQAAGGNRISYDNDLEYLLVGRVVAEAQHEVYIRVKEIETVKVIGVAEGNTKEVCYINLYLHNLQLNHSVLT